MGQFIFYFSVRNPNRSNRCLWQRQKDAQILKEILEEYFQEESESDSENDETNQDEGYQEPGQPVILVDDDPNTSNKEALKRRVSFAADVTPDSQSSNEIR